MPSRPGHLYGVQILRGIAALLVLLHHQAQGSTSFPGMPVLNPLLDGAFGVDLFFPISGFVMFLTAESLLRKPQGPVPRWHDFAWRRILRIVPLY